MKITKKGKLILTRFNNLNRTNIVSLILMTFLFLSSCSGVSNKSKDKPAILFGKVDFRGDSTSLNNKKFDAALALALRLSGKYDYYGSSHLQKVFEEKPDLSQKKIGDIAKNLNADYIAIATVNVLKHIIRTQITLSKPNSSDKPLTGIGYDVINFIDANSGEMVYDPALLKSLQRALSSATNDSNMFVNKQLGINVKPLPTLVVGSIAFTGEDQYDWKLYLDKVVSSFAGIETIYDLIKYSDDYVIYDTDTRDTVYKLFNFHIVENYSHPSNHEIRALYQMAVDYYIAGSLDKTKDGANLTIGLYAITADGLKLIKSEKESFNDDSRMVFLEYVSRATKRLFDITEKPEDTGLPVEDVKD